MYISQAVIYVSSILLILYLSWNKLGLQLALDTAEHCRQSIDQSLPFSLALPNLYQSQRVVALHIQLQNLQVPVAPDSEPT